MSAKDDAKYAEGWRSHTATEHLDIGTDIEAVKADFIARLTEQGSVELTAHGWQFTAAGTMLVTQIRFTTYTSEPRNLVILSAIGETNLRRTAFGILAGVAVAGGLIMQAFQATIPAFLVAVAGLIGLGWLQIWRTRRLIDDAVEHASDGHRVELGEIGSGRPGG